MGRLIDADALQAELLRMEFFPAMVKAAIRRPPTVDAVPAAAYEQVRWERDMAMKQLKEHGIPFGGVAPDVVEMVRKDGDGMMERTEYIEKWKVVNMLIDVENRAQGTYRENGEKLYRDLVETEIKIGKLPAADVAPVRSGRWINAEKINHKPYRIKKPEKWVIYRCSECGYSNGRRTNANYCPNCGAKMGGGHEDG